MASTTKRDLQRDLEAYSCGEVPSPLELLRAPLIERWGVEVRPRGKEFVLLVKGEALRHPEYGDGDPADEPRRTSRPSRKLLRWIKGLLDSPEQTRNMAAHVRRARALRTPRR